jgi:5'-methylthioadenosine phosphorylase
VIGALGGTVVGMTGVPEASVARELAMCYSTVCLVTDHDAGVVVGEAVSHAEVLRVFGRNVERMRGLLADLVTALPQRDAECGCAAAVEEFTLPFDLP